MKKYTTINTDKTIGQITTTIAYNNVVIPTSSNNSLSSNTFIELENKILQNRNIRLEKTLKKDLPTNLKDFLVAFFKIYNFKKATIFTDNKTIQTTAGKRRSLGDIFKICRYYFPTCTLKEVLILLYVTIPNIITSGYRSSYCFTIEKRVFYYAEENDNNTTNCNISDEYGHRVEWYKSKL